MGMNPKVSIITVVFNAEDHIKKTLKSIVNQTYRNIEVIVVDGKSTDNTLNIVDEFHGHNIRILSEPDKGIYDAMNKGIELSAGDYIAFLNAGDEYCDNDTIEKLFQHVNDEDLVYGDYVAILGRNTQYKKANLFSSRSLHKNLTSIVCHQSLFIKRKIAPLYNIQYKLKGELDWYFNILNIEKIKYLKVNIPIVYYLRGGVSDQKCVSDFKEMIAVIWWHKGFLGILMSSKALIKHVIKIVLIVTKVYRLDD